MPIWLCKVIDKIKNKKNEIRNELIGNFQLKKYDISSAKIQMYQQYV
jgi:hypothetical protein